MQFHCQTYALLLIVSAVSCLGAEAVDSTGHRSLFFDSWVCESNVRNCGDEICDYVDDHCSARGPQGHKGDTGKTGPPGPKGDRGPAGRSGGGDGGTLDCVIRPGSRQDIVLCSDGFSSPSVSNCPDGYEATGCGVIPSSDHLAISSNCQFNDYDGCSCQTCSLSDNRRSLQGGRGGGGQGGGGQGNRPRPPPRPRSYEDFRTQTKCCRVAH